jgi:hypothetical protein
MANLTGFQWKNGTAGTYAMPGIIIGGEDGTNLTNWQHHHGASGVEKIQASDVVAEPSVQVKCTDATKTLMALAYRASYPHGAIDSDLIIQFGDDDRTITVGENVAGDGATGCAINEMSVSWAEGGVLEASFGFVGLGAKWASTGISQAALGGSEVTFCDGMGVVTVASAELAVVGFEYTHRNGLSTRAPAVTRTSSQKRWPTVIQQSIAENTLRLTCLTDHDTDLDGDTVAHAVAATVVFNNGTTTITFTVSNGGLQHAPIRLREREDGRVEREFELDMAQGAVALT